MALRRRSLRVLATVGSLCSLSLAASDAHAWTPTTHVYLAQKAWEDAQDGKVTINLVDHDGRIIKNPLGEYEVSPEILAAIRSNPHAFFAGVLGPDAYPDIVHGQMRIHPPGAHHYTGPDANTHGSGTNNWLMKLWATAHTPGPDRTPQNLAFVTGYLAHAAGDMYAHTFMNTFTGGIFNLKSENGMKHVTLEGYIGARTPNLGLVPYPVGGTFGGVAIAPGTQLEIHDAVDRFGIENGVRDYIARTLVDAHVTPPMTPDETGGAEFARSLSFLAIFNDIRNQLRSSVAAYENAELPYRNRVGYTHALALWSSANIPGVIARACGGPQTACPDPTKTAATCPAEYPTGDKGFCAGTIFSAGGFAALQAAIASGALIEWINFKAWGMREFRYFQQKSQINEIDIGIPKWIETSHDAAQAWFFNTDGVPDIGAFTQEYMDFLRQRLVFMVTGLPSWPSDTFGPFIEFFPNLIRPIIDDMKKDLTNWVCKTAFQVDCNALKERYTRPHAFLPQLFANQPGNGLPAVSYSRINDTMNVIGAPADNSDLGTANKKVWSVDGSGPTAPKVFPAAYNTMVMIKTLMMSPTAVNQLLTDLQTATRQNVTMGTVGSSFGTANLDNNPMLGFLESIDASNQWLHGDKLVFAKDCTAYRKIFMNQRPIKVAPETADPNPLLIPKPSNPRLWPVEIADDDPCSASLVKPFPNKGAGNQKLPQQPQQQPSQPTQPQMQAQIVPLQFFIPAYASLPAFQVSTNDAKPLAAGELPAHPPNALYPGQSLVLTLWPSDALHRWSIVGSGPGRLVDPPDPTTGQSPQAQAAKLAEFDKRAAQATVSTGSCGKGDARCLKAAHANVAQIKKERRAAAGAMKLVSATPLIGANVVYEAPATVAAATTVQIKVEATDGSNRSAIVTIALLPQPQALNVKAPTAVKAGGSFALVNDPPIPVKWTIVSGPVGGTIGDPQSPTRAQIMARDITPITNAIRQADAKLMELPPEPPTTPAPAPPASQTRFDRAPAIIRPKQLAAPERLSTQNEKNTLVRDKHKDFGAALKKVQEIDGTYKAPARASAPQNVVIKGIALDGTGRSTTITVQVTP